MRLLFSEPNEIALLSDGEVPSTVQICRTGDFIHQEYGDFSITTQTLMEFKRNFDERVKGCDIAIDYFHEADKKAAGWVKQVLISDDGAKLLAEVEWTPAAKQMLKDRELRYLSPDFDTEWIRPDTGQIYANVLNGAGLTNRPFLKDMEPIVASEKGNSMTLDELKKENKKLSDELMEVKKVEGEKEKMLGDSQAKIAQLEADIAAKMKELEALKSASAGVEKEKEAVMAENAQLKEAAKLAEKEGEFAKLLSEGKAVPAQKDAFIKGDVASFAKLAEKVNLDSKGHGGAGEADDFEKKVFKLAEEKVKAGIARHEAITQAYNEVHK